MAALPYIQLYVADYLADTMHLTTEEHGAYLLIIMNYWQTGKPIPESRLNSVARLSNDRWNSVKDSLNEFFTVDENNRWIHERIDQDLVKVKSKSTQASIAGKASAEKRAKAKAIDNKDNSSGRSNSVERKSNHTDTDTDIDTKIKKKTKGFIKPTIPEIKSFFEEKKYNIDADEFFHHYEANGWMRGKTKIVSWKSCAQTWLKNKNNNKPVNERPKPEIFKGFNND